MTDAADCARRDDPFERECAYPDFELLITQIPKDPVRAAPYGDLQDQGRPLLSGDSAIRVRHPDSRDRLS